MRLRRVLLPASLAVGALLTFGCMSQQERTVLLNRPYTLQVDYSRSIEDSLHAGRYNWVYYQVTSSNFPGTQTGQGTLSAVLVAFSPQASLDFVLGGQAAGGMRPATLKELLAFGETYPYVQRKLPVLALGSSADLMVNVILNDSGNSSPMMTFTEIVRKVKRLYPFLSGGLPGRTVNLEWLEDPEGYGMYYALFVKPQ